MGVHEVPPAELPPDCIQPVPAKPELNVLVLDNDVLDEINAQPLTVPKSVIDKYHGHPEFGKEFAEFMMDAEVNHKVGKKNPPEAEGTQKKRPFPMPDTTVPSKFPKVEDHTKFIAVSSMPSPLVHDVPIPQIKECKQTLKIAKKNSAHSLGCRVALAREARRKIAQASNKPGRTEQYRYAHEERVQTIIMQPL